MRHRSRSRGLLLLALAAAAGGCGHAGRPGGAADGRLVASSSKPTGTGDPDTEVPEGWFEGAAPETEHVEASVARDFVKAVFALVDRKIFDPAFKRAEREQAHRAVMAVLAAQPALTRADVVAALDQALQLTGMSHLRLLGPTIATKVFTAARSAPAAEVATQVSSRRAGSIAIIRVGSFMVPEISERLVADAARSLEGAAAVLLDLRGNGGGSMSSRVYLAQRLLGANQTVGFFRGRAGAGRAQAFVQRGFLPDGDNQGSSADVALNAREGFVEWRTSASAPAPFAGPAYLLIDGRCASACDSFAAAMKDHHRARLLGTRTMGRLLSASAFKTSWRGYLAFVPVGMELSPSGHVIEGIGVSPDVDLPACAAPAAASAGEDDACLRTALDLVERELGGR